jgi:hypothetical protein
MKQPRWKLNWDQPEIWVMQIATRTFKADQR